MWLSVFHTKTYFSKDWQNNYSAKIHWRYFTTNNTFLTYFLWNVCIGYMCYVSLFPISVECHICVRNCFCLYDCKTRKIFVSTIICSGSKIPWRTKNYNLNPFSPKENITSQENNLLDNYKNFSIFFVGLSISFYIRMFKFVKFWKNLAT